MPSPSPTTKSKEVARSRPVALSLVGGGAIVAQTIKSDDARISKSAMSDSRRLFLNILSRPPVTAPSVANTAIAAVSAATRRPGVSRRLVPCLGESDIETSIRACCRPAETFFHRRAVLADGEVLEPGRHSGRVCVGSLDAE